MSEKIASKLLKLMSELDILTILPRAGWHFAGIDKPESVSDHCYQTALLSLFIAESTDSSLDITKVLKLALLHDAAESRLTDLPRRAVMYLGSSKTKAEAIINRDLFADISLEVVSILDEFDNPHSLEAKIVVAAHDLQNLFKALMYANAGKGNLSEYITDALNYNDRGIPLAREICDIILRQLQAQNGQL